MTPDTQPIKTLRRTRQIAGKLTDALLRNLPAEDKQYKKADGNSLFILVKPTGLRSWMWKYTFAGKPEDIHLGNYPEVKLEEARSRRDEARRKVRAGINPNEEKRALKYAARSTQENSFRTVALMWWEHWKVSHHPRYAQDVLSRFEANVFPQIGHRPIAEIEAPEIVAMMEKIQTRGATDIARRARNTCSQVFTYAMGKGLAKRNPAGDVKPDVVLHRREVINHARIDDREVPVLMRKIDAYQGTTATRFAVKLIAYTFVRTSELIGARWEEIDWDKAEWRIPAARMKKRRVHIVPLAPQVLDLLRTLQLATGRFELLFPGERDTDKPMSDNTILKALERMGYKSRMTGHGFRGLASTHLYEKQFPSDHIELQLAHVKEKVRGAYDYSHHLPERRKMMEYWANFLSKA